MSAQTQTRPRITQNDYAIELFQGPFIAPVRVSGLAGAMVAAVEGVEGVYNNAAAPAVREPFSLKWFDYDVQGGFSFPGAYRRTDFANRGEKGDPSLIERTDDFNYYNLGAQLQFGGLGVTAMGDFIQYSIASRTGGDSLTLTLGRIQACAGYGFLDNQLVIGAGARIAIVNIDRSFSTRSLIAMAGASPQAGVVVKPNDVPWRLGATVRAPVTAGNLDIGTSTVEPATGVRTAGEFITPARITQPWEVEVGVAYQLGPRPHNPAWINPSDQEHELQQRIARRREERRLAQEAAASEAGSAESGVAALAREEVALRLQEDDELLQAKERLYAERHARYLNWPRERILLLASVLLTGPSSEAVAIEGFIDQRRELVGQSLSVAPRFAVETEPIPNLIRVRSGVYIEPSRFDDGNKRQHFTFGADVRTFTWDLFGAVPQTTIRMSAFIDVAPRYENFGFGIGVWH